MKIYSDDGKVFNSVDECNAYETDLALKKQKEEAERKAKEERKEYRYNQVLDKIDSLNKVVESYELETGEKLEYVNVNGKLEVRPYGLLGVFNGIKLFTNR